MSYGGSRTSEKPRRQEQRGEWLELVKHFPMNDAREKHAVELVLCLFKKKGALDYSAATEATEALVLQGGPFAKYKPKFANQIRGWANRVVHAQQESARFIKHKIMAAEDGGNFPIPQPCATPCTHPWIWHLSGGTMQLCVVN